MATDRNTLKNWFVRGAKPLASQFAAWIDSFWHRDDAIPVSSVENLNEILGDKIDRQEIDNIAGSILLERRIPIYMEADTADFFIGEEMTIYKVECANVATLQINGQEVALTPVTGENGITSATTEIAIPPRKYMQVAVTRSGVDARADIFIYAKARVQ